MNRVVVVGHGMVGHRVRRGATRPDTGGRCEITVLAEERRPAYDRVRLSAYFDGETARPGPGYPASTSGSASRHWHSISPPARCATAGGEYDYDALVLATGSYPFVPPVPGGSWPAASSTAPSTTWRR